MKTTVNVKKYNNPSKESWLFIGASVIPLAIITIFPMVFLYYISMTNYELGTQLSEAKFVGLSNYIRLFSGRDPEFFMAIKNTIILGVIATSVELFLGSIIAFIVHSLKKIRGFWFSILMIPMVVTPVIVGLVWKLMLNSQHGVINWILDKTIGWSPAWLGPKLSFLSIFLVEVWQWTPFMALIILSGLSSLPNEPIEASLVDGANPFQRLVHIIIPILQPIILLGILFRIIDIFKMFDVIYIMTGGGPGSSTEVLSIHAYRLGFAQTGWIGRASATSVLLAILTISISIIVIKRLQKSYQER